MKVGDLDYLIIIKRLWNLAARDFDVFYLALVSLDEGSVAPKGRDEEREP